jgi:carbonic anhydrase
VQDVYQKHELEISKLPQKGAQADRLCELNVIEQVVNVCQTTVVQDAWMRGDKVTIHGWIYALKDGKLRDLGMTISSPEEMRAAYQLAVHSA